LEAELSQKIQDVIRQKPFHTIPETAQLLNITRAHVYNLARQGELRIVKVAGRSSGVPSDDVIAYANRRLTEAAS
jgi:excisionase family DNA binding protein